METVTQVRDKLGQAKTLHAKALIILGNPDATAEEKASVQGLMKDAEALKNDAQALKSILDSGIDSMIEESKKLPGYGSHTDLPAGNPGGTKLGDQPPSPDKWKTWGDYLYHVWLAMHPNPTQVGGFVHPLLKDRFHKDEAGPSNVKDMTEAVGSAGGYLVPTEFQTELLAIMGENGIGRPRATVIPMRRRQLDMPVLDQTGTTAGQPHWFGGLQFYWEEEAGQKTASDPVFRKISLVAHKLIGFTRASDELLDDSAIGLDAFLRGPMGFGGGASWIEDYTFLQGNGAGQPLGIIKAGATITITRATAGTVAFADFANMVANFLPSARGVWIISQSLMADVIQLNGPSGNPSYIWTPNARDGIPGTLLGYPVIWSEKVPPAGYAGDVVLADWRYYLIGDRQATTVESTKFERWQYDQTSWRMVHRVDGQPWLSAPLTYQDAETQVSPFCMLGGTATS